MHIKHLDGSFEYVPYFCLPANDLTDVIAPSCYSCFDYPNALADLVCYVHPVLSNFRDLHYWTGLDNFATLLYLYWC